MNNIFETVLNMSITGCIVIAIIIVIRFFLKRAPKKYSYALWSIALFRLCCPFSFKSAISIFNLNPIQKPSSIVTGNGAMNYINAPINIPTPAGDETVAAIGGAAAPQTVIVAGSHISSITSFIPYIWLAGVCAFLLYGIASYIKNKIKACNGN